MLDTPIETAPQAPRDLADGLFARARDTTTVTLRLGPRARWVVEYYPVERVRDAGDGGLEVDLVVADQRWLTRLLLRLAPHARVVGPAELGADLTAPHRTRSASTTDRGRTCGERNPFRPT